MKLVPMSLLVVPLIVVTAAGMVRAAPGETRPRSTAAARDLDRATDRSDAEVGERGQPMRGAGRGWGMEMCGPGCGMEMRGPGMGARRGMGARGGEGMRGGMGARLLGPEGRLLRGGGTLADQLKLTGTQREKLRDIGGDLARRVIRARADLAVARLDLADALRKDSPSRQEAEERIDAIVKLETSLMKDAVTARLDVREVLTSDQRKQLAELRWRGPAREMRAPGAARDRTRGPGGGRFSKP